MGRIFAGMGFSTAPVRLLTAENAEFAENSWIFDFDGVFGACLETDDPCFPPLFFPPPFSAGSAFSAVKAFCLLSARATASASQAALSFPRVAGRLLVHSAEPASPAIWLIVRPVKTEVS